MTIADKAITFILVSHPIKTRERKRKRIGKGRVPTLLSHDFDTFSTFSFPCFTSSTFKVVEIFRR
jgi:hypothetical protein